MIIKQRVESEELVIHHILSNRIRFNAMEAQHYQRLKDGYRGEKIFDTYTNKIACEHLIIQDLLLSWNNTLFQIDTLLILPEIIYLYEIKYFKDDYLYGDQHLIKLPSFEVANPLHQVQKSESLLKHLLKGIGLPQKVHSYVAFVHPTFFMFETPRHHPFLFLPQLDKHIHHLNNSNNKLTFKDKDTAEVLLKSHIPRHPNLKLPNYSFDKIQKGTSCAKCRSLNTRNTGKNVLCLDCQHRDGLEDAIYRGAEEFLLLFPKMDLTAQVLQVYLNIFPYSKTIYKVLSKYYSVNIKKRPYVFYKKEISSNSRDIVLS